uniref:Innexin n=1 Tax=Meloidogyne enterolobii TaxID=390850 RepID=A0A6V7VQM3_MELEN|nr:unnamed protein product [Meloidogyne enterolobii]
MVFSEVVGTLSFLQPQADDDMTDRLHYYYTTTFLLVTSVLISLKMYGGRPIECWMPAEYQSSWQEYTEIYCFSMNTYFTPFDKQIPDESEVREKNMISYYQWTPFFLVICAFLFYSPCLVWRALYTKSGIRIKDIVAFANDRSNIQPKLREANVKGMSAHLGSVFRHRFRFSGKHHPHHHKLRRALNLRYYEAYLTFLYIGIKTLFLANVSMQMFLMNWFLQTSNYRYYGFGVLEDLISGRAWSDSGNFPRITYCDMDVRVLGAIQRHTVQCVLVINIFIEKFFILLWIWYSLLFILTIISLFKWILCSFPFEARKRFIARRLELADIEFKRINYEPELTEFVRDYIKMDGVFMLRMLTIHSGILVCTEVVDSMWEEFNRSSSRLQRAHLLASSPQNSSVSLIRPSDELQPLQTSKHVSNAIQQNFKRKTSVLVPLVSAQPNGVHHSGFFFQSVMTHSPSFSQQHQTHTSSSTAAAQYSTGAGISAATNNATNIIMPPPPRGDFLLRKPPNSQQWRTQRKYPQPSITTIPMGDCNNNIKNNTCESVYVHPNTTQSSVEMGNGVQQQQSLIMTTTPTSLLTSQHPSKSNLNQQQQQPLLQTSQQQQTQEPALWEVEESMSLVKEESL